MATELGTIDTTLSASGNTGDVETQELAGEQIIRGGLPQVSAVTLFISVTDSTGVEVHVDGRINDGTEYASAGSYTASGSDPPTIEQIEIGGVTDLRLRAENTDSVTADVRIDAAAATS
jgi:hypothetical protein